MILFIVCVRDFFSNAVWLVSTHMEGMEDNQELWIIKIILLDLLFFVISVACHPVQFVLHSIFFPLEIIYQLVHYQLTINTHN